MGYLLIGHAEVSTDMSSTTLDNPAMYDVWCCQRWWILAASASSPVGNLRQVRKKQTTDAVFLFLFGSQVMLNQDELNIAGHPLWIWSVVWLEHSFQIFCFVRSFLGAFVPCTVEKLLSHRWVQEIICGSLCSVPLQTAWFWTFRITFCRMMSRWHISSGGETQIKPCIEVPSLPDLWTRCPFLGPWPSRDLEVREAIFDGRSMENRHFCWYFFVTPCNSRHTINLSIEYIKPSISVFRLQSSEFAVFISALLPSSRHPPVTPATWKPLRTFGASWLSGGSVLQGGRWKFWRTSFSQRETVEKMSGGL